MNTEHRDRKHAILTRVLVYSAVLLIALPLIGLLLFFRYVKSEHDSGVRSNFGTTFRSADEDYEGFLISKVVRSETPRERRKWMKKLEQLPIQTSFTERWLAIQDDKIPQFHLCWSDEGYAPEQCEATRDFQIFLASYYGMADIYNGGLHQFFTNSTGVVAPEMEEWFRRSGHDKAADAMRDAMQFFGEPYPRAREKRQEIIWSLDEDVNPFVEADSALIQDFPWEQNELDRTSDRWLKEKCGVKRLADVPPTR